MLVHALYPAAIWDRCEWEKSHTHFSGVWQQNVELFLALGAGELRVRNVTTLLHVSDKVFGKVGFHEALRAVECAPEVFPLLVPLDVCADLLADGAPLTPLGHSNVNVSVTWLSLFVISREALLIVRSDLEHGMLALALGADGKQIFIMPTLVHVVD